MIPYDIITLFASFVLVPIFVFITEASRVGKGVVFGLFIFSLVSYSGRITVDPLFGLLLMNMLSIFIIMYRKWHKEN